MGKDQELLDAARSGNIAYVGKLLDQIAKRASGPLSSFRRSPSINAQDMNGYTPLHHACLNGHSNIVRLLLAHDSLPDVPDIRGSTPLYLAAWAGHHDIVKMLLMYPRRPANPNIQTTDNETPLHCAAQHGHNSALAILLSYGADPTIRNSSFQTPLDLAAHFGRLQAVQILIRTHPKLIEPYKMNTASTCDLISYLPQNFAATSPTKHIFTHTCLHLASRNGHKKVVETLLAAGVDVNILTHSGTALHEAALCGKKSVVTTLLEAGINPYAKDGNGRTALDLLKDYPLHVTYEIASVIEEFCKRIESNCCFKPITTDGDLKDANFISTTENDDHEKSHSMPKSAWINKQNDQTTNSIKSTVTHSNSLDSLENDTSASPNYLHMRPIMRKSPSSDIIEPRNRSDYEEYTLSNESKSTNERPVYKRIMQKPKPFELNSEPVYANTRYHCIDEYIKMTDPNQLNSNTSTPEKPIPSPRRFKAVDSENVDDLNKTAGNLKQDRELSSFISPTNSQWLDANNNKQHSPTPDFPPPSVSQAEDTIIEFIHPPRPPSRKPNKRRSIHIECTENSDEDIETIITKHIDMDNKNNHVDEDDISLSSLLRPKRSTPTPTHSTRASDCVEEFIGDAPFAGLFKGSALNLVNDEVDGFVFASNRLRSPSLVRSIKPIPSKRNTVSPTEAVTSVEEDFNATKVWEEINSILESIDIEMRNNEEIEIERSEDPSNETLNTNELPSQPLAIPTPIKIRNPSELLLGMKSNTNAKWCHSPSTLIYGQVNFEVYYLGSTVIRELQGTISTRKSIQKLKRGETPVANEQDSSILENCNTSTKYLKAANKQAKLQVGIAISHVGVRFIDVKEKSTICVHDIQNINCVCQDVEDLRYFAYITKEQELHYCHVFMVDELELATEIILTLGQAFEVAYQLALVEEQSPERH